MQVEICGEVFELFPQKAMYWHKVKALLLADIHLGKINHFRRSGIPLPTGANDRNIELLMDMLRITKAERVICLGDLFHSFYNPEWEVFGEVVKHYRNIAFELVLGNHDVMSDLQYVRKGIRVYHELAIDNFILTHHPMEAVRENSYNLAGHIHPGVHLYGKGKQGMTVPCFHFGRRQGLLPAFGVFTGLAKVRPLREDQVFVVVENKIIKI